MIYQDETLDIKIYDPLSGEEISYLDTTPEYEAHHEKLIQDGKAVKSMRYGDGWAVVEKFLLAEAQSCQEHLVGAKDLNTIQRLQEAIKAYRTVLTFVEATILESDHLQEHVRTTTDPE